MSVNTPTPRKQRFIPPSSSHPVDQVLPAGRMATLGIQHLLIMYASAVAVPLIVGAAVGLPTESIAVLVSADLLVSGIFTIIQAVGIGKILGVRLPVVTAATFTVLSPMIIIATSFTDRTLGMQVVYGAMICSGVFGVLIAKPFSRLIRFFPPLVAGTTITIIGLSLIGADVGLIAGEDPTAASYGQVSHIVLAVVVVLIIVLISRFFTGFLNQIAVLISLVIGTIISGVMGLNDFSAVADEKWIGFGGIFHFGPPKFQVAAIVSLCLVMLVTFTESTADMLAVAEMVDKELKPNDLARGLANDGLSAVVGGVMNAFPDTSFAQNVGLVGITRVHSRWVVATTGVFLVIMGFIPKVGAVVASIPGPVIGGAATVMFAMVAAVGIQTLHKANFKNNQNLLIVAVSLSFGMIPTVAPHFYDKFPEGFRMVFGSGITSTVIVVFILNLLFNHWVRGPRGEHAVQHAVDSGAGAPDTRGDDGPTRFVGE
ncbi:purine permease [Pseudactinotalea sp. HY160]|uniref:nucleobase:cation symporter-2 family protein n=1 Tax=Pseudactinotalea sp. HY160 TaxID=2654490 RepID=UPI00128B7132|nr:nucleobase:cation symporter-2 family protein [Pseudactinotalea sp. HY160]MPV51179.1 purine permease [Pseudactinotalea sp. HY160]